MNNKKPTNLVGFIRVTCPIFPIGSADGESAQGCINTVSACITEQVKLDIRQFRPKIQVYFRPINVVRDQVGLRPDKGCFYLARPCWYWTPSTLDWGQPTPNRPLLAV